MAVSVRLPPQTGPYIEHYLIQSLEGILCLESSRFKFDSIPALIAHYAQCCDELPVQLLLPKALLEAKNRQQLSSLALLGQEFWRYPMSCPNSKQTSETSEALFLDAKSPNSNTDTSGLGTTTFSNSACSYNLHEQTSSNKMMSPNISSQPTGPFSPVGTPSDTASSMSSFTASGGAGVGQHIQLASPESVDSILLTMSPTDAAHKRHGVLGLGCDTNLTNLLNTSINNLSTFKAVASTPHPPILPKSIQVTEAQEQRMKRPKPPNTLNLDLRKPPAPPVRWTKPLSPTHSQPALHHLSSEQVTLSAANNFTVTTTVTFSVDGGRKTPQFVDVKTPTNSHAAVADNNNASLSNCTMLTFSKRLSPEGECKDTISSHGSSSGSQRQATSHTQPLICNESKSKPLAGLLMAKGRKSKARKESKHYQESDILESPEIYCRSTLHDKISDYEDLWSHDVNDRVGLLTSFKPTEEHNHKRPDLLAETPRKRIITVNYI